MNENLNLYKLSCDNITTKAFKSSKITLRLFCHQLGIFLLAFKDQQKDKMSK